MTQRQTTQPHQPIPFASYAQIVRMLVPLADKVSFYDAQGEALWISDGVEEPELRTCIEVLLAQYAAKRVNETPLDYAPRGRTTPTYAIPVHDSDRKLLGALGVVCRDAAGHAAQTRMDTVERLLAPLIEILGYGWHASAPVVAPFDAKPNPAPAPALAADTSPAPAALRRTLVLATQRIECAFGAIVVADQPFTLSHRASPDESDLAINSVIDAVRAHLLKLMQVRHEPLIANCAVPGRAQYAPYKFLAYPLRSAEQRLVALVVLFRSAHDRSFVSWDIEALADITSELSDDVLAGFTRPDPAAAPASGAGAASIDRLRSDHPLPLPDPRSTPAPVLARVTHTRVQPITMEACIRLALRENAFDLHTQEIRALHDERRPARYEVLLRMHDADKLRTPHAFFGAAEAGNLMPELDRWVVRNLLQTLCKHSAAVRAGRLEFCINIAAQSLNSDRFGEFIVAEVCRSAIPASLLVFEFSEANALEHQQAVEIMSARLRDVGCRIALDNCRGGFDTLSTLRKWPVSCVKIDGSLIRDVIGNSRSESLVRAVAQLAGGIGIETVAECVETESVREKLLDIGIDYAQGFHLGHPQPIGKLFHPN